MCTRCVTGSCCRSIARANDKDELASVDVKLVIVEGGREAGNGYPSPLFFVPGQLGGESFLFSLNGGEGLAKRKRDVARSGLKEVRDSENIRPFF